MAKYTNNAAGARVIVHKDGKRTLVEPGQSIEADNVASAHPDLETGTKAAKSDDAKK